MCIDHALIVVKQKVLCVDHVLTVIKQEVLCVDYMLTVIKQNMPGRGGVENRKGGVFTVMEKEVPFVDHVLAFMTYK